MLEFKAWGLPLVKINAINVPINVINVSVTAINVSINASNVLINAINAHTDVCDFIYLFIVHVHY